MRLTTPEQYTNTLTLRERFQETLDSIRVNRDPKRPQIAQRALEDSYQSQIDQFSLQLREYEERNGIPETVSIQEMEGAEVCSN